MKRYFLAVLVFALSCSENGWNSDRKFFLENECVENAKGQIFDEKELLSVCECVLKNFIDNFSWDEYQKMLNMKITNENNPEINSKLQVYISSVMKECKISL